MTDGTSFACLGVPFLVGGNQSRRTCRAREDRGRRGDPDQAERGRRRRAHRVPRPERARAGRAARVASAGEHRVQGVQEHAGPPGGRGGRSHRPPADARGPIAFAFVRGDAVLAAKALKDFGRTNPELVVKGGLLGRRLLTAGDSDGPGRRAAPRRSCSPRWPAASRRRSPRRPACSRRSPATSPTACGPDRSRRVRAFEASSSRPRTRSRDRSNQANTDELLDVFKNMTVLELNEFLKAFEEEFGVTAAAPVAVAAAGARRRATAARLRPRSRTSSTSSSPRPASEKIKVIKEVRSLTSLGLKEAKDLVESRAQAGPREGLQGGRREGQGAARRRRRQVELK